MKISAFYFLILNQALDNFNIDKAVVGPMVLDGLIHIKNKFAKLFLNDSHRFVRFKAKEISTFIIVKIIKIQLLLI